ncbi:MAG: YbhB/YbcL family Raf kinase inhibitor-like protein [Brachybacterium sp.]|nr:YbhB/YbcL family Raf kinase inhibitor-like protein [Brachybacterium sp.]
MTENTFTVTSTDLPEGSVIDGDHLSPELGGSSVSPDLRWTGAPEGTKSFAVTCFDPDAPTGSGFWHWVAWDIPADATGLDGGIGREDESLQQAANDFGRVGFDGPNPPTGPAHRYQFTVHALPVESLGADPADPHIGARFAIHTQQLASATVTSTYQVAS